MTTTRKTLTSGKTTAILKLLGSVVHSVQRERGCACLYLDSGGEIFKNEFLQQIEVVDQSILNLKRYVVSASQDIHIPEDVLTKLSGLITRLDGLKELRANIKELTLFYTSALNQYTFIFNVLLIDTMVEFAHQTPEFLSLNVSAFANFLQWKERLGMERALGARGFYSGAFHNPEFKDRLTSLLAEQQAYQKNFLMLASPDQGAILQEVMDSSSNRQAEKFNQIILKGDSLEDLKEYSGEEWFSLITNLIDLLYEVEDKLIETLAAPHEDTKPGLASNISPARKTAFDSYRPFIRSLPIFSSLSNSELDTLLNFGQIRNHDKGKLLFLQGEASSRLYIILRGWVKVYNGLESGEETILQMLSSGDTLLESAVFLNTVAPVSAQAVEDTILLSIPAPIIRKRVEESNPFAVSMLNNVSLRSQRLIQQIEQSRLKSAGDRVGWFLLSQYLNHSNEIDDGRIELPFDKSVIASYLDMRPETFSRTLKKLKDQGFELKKDQILMPNPRALCKFCDSYTAEGCDLADTEDCPHPDIGIFNKDIDLY